MTEFYYNLAELQYEFEMMNNYEDDEQKRIDYEDEEAIEIIFDYYMESDEKLYEEYNFGENNNIKISAMILNSKFKKQAILSYKNEIITRRIELKNEEDIKNCKIELKRNSKKL